MGQITSAKSEQSNPERAAAEIVEKLGRPKDGLVVYFAPRWLDQKRLHRAFADLLGDKVAFIGASSMHINLPLLRMRHNIASDGFSLGVCAMAFAGVKAEVASIDDVADGGVEKSLVALERLAKAANLDLKGDVSKHFLLFFCDGPTGHADAILDALFVRAPGLVLAGGGTAGALNLATGLVSSGWATTNQGTYRRGAALALVRTDLRFAAKMVTNYEATDNQFEITKGEGKTLTELNGRPAAKEYARLLGHAPWHLGPSILPNFRLLLQNPVGLVVDKQPYLRGIAAKQGNALRTVVGDARPGQMLRLMRRGDIVAATKKAVAEVTSELGKVAGTLMFSCAYRELEGNIINKQSEIEGALRMGPVAGLMCFGEYFQGLAVEQTLTLLAFAE